MIDIIFCDGIIILYKDKICLFCKIISDIYTSSKDKFIKHFEARIS